MKTWIGILTAAVVFLGIGYLNLYCSGMKFNDNSAGVVISALGVLVTALVGWQIYNAIEMRSIIREYDKLKNQFNESNKALILQDERNLTLIEAYAKIKEADSEFNSFSENYKIYLQSLELFLKANVPIKYKPIIDIKYGLKAILRSLKHVDIEERQKFLQCEKLFDDLNHQILNSLHKRQDDIKELVQMLTEIRDTRKEVCADLKKKNRFFGINK